MDIIALYGTELILIAAAVGFLMAWGIGANDVANAMGTSVGTRSLTIRQAILIAMIFEFAGAYLAGGEVTATIKDGIIDPNAFAATPHLLVLGMIAALLAAGLWLLLASHFGWPVSTTHSIIGAIVGFSLVSVGAEAVAWDRFAGIVGSWIITPAISGLLAYLLFMSLQRFIFSAPDPLRSARSLSPLYIFLTAMVICVVTLEKGLKHVGVPLSHGQSLLLSVLLSLLAALLGALAIRRLTFESDSRLHYANVEKVFAVLMVGAIMGVGLARGIAAINLGVVRNIVVSWVITLPSGALLAIIIFTLLRALVE